MPFLKFLEKAAARKKGMHVGAKVWIFMSFWSLGGDCSTQKGHAFWSKSVDFYAFLGFLGKGAALKKGVHFKAKVWISMSFLGLLGGFAE